MHVRLSLGWLFIITLSACTGLGQGVNGAPVGKLLGSLHASPTVSTSITPDAQQLLALSRVTPSSVPTLRPAKAPTATPALPSPTATPSYTPTSTVTSTPIFKMCSPVATLTLAQLPRYISDGYHPPPPRSDGRHEGVDISYYQLNGKINSIMGAGIQSVLAGRVAAAIADSFPYGNFVIVETRREMLPAALVEKLNIRDGQSLYLLYAHMQEPPPVNLAQEVTACQSVGKVGQTGNTNAPHLHFEARLGPPGVTFTVMSAFLEGVTEEQRANYNLWRTSGEYNHFDPMLLLTYLP